MNVWFKGGIRENRHVTDHVQVAHDQNVAHDQKIWIIEKFEQKIDFGEKYIFGLISGQTWKIVIFSDFGGHVSLRLTCISGYGYDMDELGLDYV